MRDSLLEVHPVTSKHQFVFPEAPARHHLDRSRARVLANEHEQYLGDVPYGQ